MSENDKYRKTLGPLLDPWNADVDKVEAKIKKAGVDPNADCDEQIVALQSIHCYQAEDKPFENQKNIVSAWKDLKKGLEKHMDCL